MKNYLVSGAFWIVAATSACASPAWAGLTYAPDQTSDGVRYIVVSGEFAFEDNLDQFSSIVRSHNPSGVSFNSPGGNVSKAMQLGRLIRSFGLDTVQPRAIECASACALAFIGGVTRYAEPGSIGVHKSSFSGDHDMDTKTAVSAVQQLTAEVMTYMIEMGVDPALLQLSLQYESDDIRYLSRSEMEQYKVTTEADGNQQIAQPRPLQPALATPQPLAAPPVQPQTTSVLTIPEAQSGRVRHPKGAAPVKTLPDGKSPSVANLRNGATVAILGNAKRWYRVRSGGHVGYMHDTWVHVDQYQSGPFEQRHIQIKSFDNYAAAEAYVRSSPISLSIYLATNSWFAITLRDTYAQDDAKNLVTMMKEAGTIPEDSYVSYGNTYVRKVCCG